TDASISERVEDLISRMTIEEKIGQMTQLNITMINSTGVQKDVDIVEEKARDFLLNHHVGSFLNGEAVPGKTWYDYSMKLQRIAVEETRLGIPIIYGIDHIHGATYLAGSTVFPQAINLGATFNDEHSRQTGRITVIESADLGHHWNFAPVLDLGRNPLWPRLYETFGESPYVAARHGVAYTEGLQDVPEAEPYVVASTGKHFLGYGDPKSGWDRTPVDLSMQTIYEFHAPAFQASFDAGMKTIMVNSGEINGVPVHGSKVILTDLLRNYMNFEGVVVTDWNDIGKMVDYHYTARDYKEATLQSVLAGIDMSMTPLSLAFNEALIELVAEGSITEERIDESVRRILKLKFELGLFENPYPRNDRFNRIGAKEHRAKALQAAEESIVLLKNDDNVLPLSKSVKILVVGPSANSKRNLAGGWTLAWQGGKEEQYPKEMLTISSALKQRYGKKNVSMLSGTFDEKTYRDAVSKVDVVVAAIGEEPYTEFVGNITSLELPSDQKELIRSLSAFNKPVVGVFVGGRPRIVADVIDDMDAYLFAGLPGFEGAQAIANVLSGDANPSGKLPISYPKYNGHFVPHNHKPSDVYYFNPEEANDIQQGQKSVWQWEFGTGLSYTTFEYSNLSLADTVLSEADYLKAEVTVTNTGNRKGMESVIWYTQDEVGTISRPVKEVKFFEKIELNPGESKTVSFTIFPEKHLSFPSHDGELLLEQGYFNVKVGGMEKRFYLQKNSLAESK
ncbi:MAG: glycoside hydrolase family 3 N-terminal domain-containing protein, partial [Bacteroidota bacterium]